MDGLKTIVYSVGCGVICLCLIAIIILMIMKLDENERLMIKTVEELQRLERNYNCCIEHNKRQDQMINDMGDEIQETKELVKVQSMIIKDMKKW